MDVLVTSYAGLWYLVYLVAVARRAAAASSEQRAASSEQQQRAASREQQQQGAVAASSSSSNSSSSGIAWDGWDDGYGMGWHGHGYGMGQRWGGAERGGGAHLTAGSCLHELVGLRCLGGHYALQEYTCMGGCAHEWAIKDLHRPATRLAAGGKQT